MATVFCCDYESKIWIFKGFSFKNPKNPNKIWTFYVFKVFFVKKI